jgi:hypothetical protein
MSIKFNPAVLSFVSALFVATLFVSAAIGPAAPLALVA